MKSLNKFWRVLADELASGCRNSTNIDRCKTTVNERFEHEGLSFFTITLPAFAKDFERSLAAGQVDPHLSFHSWKFRGGLPAFLGGFLDQVFDRRSGDLLDVPDAFSIQAIRQLTLVFGKIELRCTPEREGRALRQYVEIDEEVGEWVQSYIGSDIQSEFLRAALLIAGDVFAKLDEDVYYDRVIPKHGPGVTADRLTGNGKFYQIEWPQRLETVFPYGEYCIPSWRHYYRLDDVQFLTRERERPVKVILVPKTQKTPRIIAVEPTGMQYVQQGLMASVVAAIEADDILGAVIGFRDQSPNQQLALKGSRDGSLATLDLSEASDRVSFQHVLDLLHYFPFAREGVMACRSERARVPAHFYHPSQVVVLNKFASMGSALTFPMEALVFTVVIALAIAKQNRRELGQATRWTRDYFARCLTGVRVFGDDIVVPNHYATSVIHELEAFGFKVNMGKSFWTGKFRESCGKEYYAGTDVSIVRMRQFFPSSHRDVLQIVSTVSFRNQLWLAGLFETSKWLDRRIEKVLPSYPFVGPRSDVLGRLSFDQRDVDCRDKDTQAPLVKGFVVKSTPPESLIHEEFALLKYFLKKGDKPFEDVKHLVRSGRPDAVYLKRRNRPVDYSYDWDAYYRMWTDRSRLERFHSTS